MAGRQFGGPDAEGGHRARVRQQVHGLPEDRGVHEAPGLLEPVHRLVEDLVQRRVGVAGGGAAAYGRGPAAVHETLAEFALELRQARIAERLGRAHHRGVAGSRGLSELLGGGERHVLHVVAQVLRDLSFRRGELSQPLGDAGVETGRTVARIRCSSFHDSY